LIRTASTLRTHLVLALVFVGLTWFTACNPPQERSGRVDLPARTHSADAAGATTGDNATTQTATATDEELAAEPIAGEEASAQTGTDATATPGAGKGHREPKKPE
jgi:hypothetical protein